MNDIIGVLERIFDNYPQSVYEFENYVKKMLPRDTIVDDFFLPTSKYIKNFIPIVKGDSVRYIAEEKATDEEIEKYKGFFTLKMVDYDSLSKDFHNDDFDLDKICLEKLENEIESIREFLFDCNTFKGIYFLNRFKLEVFESKNKISNLWKHQKPNWLQKEVTEKLNANLIIMESTIMEDFKGIYTETGKVTKISRKKSQPEKEKHWYKIAELMARGVIEINEKGEYLFKGEHILKEKRVSELASDFIDNKIKPESIKPYLSGTKNVKKSDKNIFSKFRLDSLIVIGIKAKEANLISEFYKNRLELLKKECI